MLIQLSELTNINIQYDSITNNFNDTYLENDLLPIENEEFDRSRTKYLSI